MPHQIGRALKRGLAAAGCAFAFYLAWCCAALVLLKWVNPFTTMVQMQRRVEAPFAPGKYVKRYTPAPLARIAPGLRHAAVAAEDTRFYQHGGIDWQELRKIYKTELDEEGVPRGGSTITQQLVKNLFFTTHRNPFRKAAEFVLAPIADRVLGKERVLELYLNVIEWGPGVYGAEAAARHYYRTGAGSLTREQATRLAACIPSPLRRRPARMDAYAAIIDQRMRSLGW